MTRGDLRLHTLKCREGCGISVTVPCWPSSCNGNVLEGLSVGYVVLRHRIPRQTAETLFSTVRSDRFDAARVGQTERRRPETRNPGSDDNGPDTNEYGHRRGLFARERQ